MKLIKISVTNTNKHWRLDNGTLITNEEVRFLVDIGYKFEVHA